MLTLLIVAFIDALAIRLTQLLTREEPEVFAELKKPATEELRQIYREIDQDCGIIEPDLLTPEKPKAKDLTPSKQKLFAYLDEQAERSKAIVEHAAEIGAFLPAGVPKKIPKKEMGEGLYKFAYGGMVYICASPEEAQQKLAELKSLNIH